MAVTKKRPTSGKKALFGKKKSVVIAVGIAVIVILIAVILWDVKVGSKSREVEEYAQEYLAGVCETENELLLTLDEVIAAAAEGTDDEVLLTQLTEKVVPAAEKLLRETTQKTAELQNEDLKTVHMMLVRAAQYRYEAVISLKDAFSEEDDEKIGEKISTFDTLNQDAYAWEEQYFKELTDVCQRYYVVVNPGNVNSTNVSGTERNEIVDGSVEPAVPLPDPS